MTEWVGWAASAILLATLIRQVRVQWTSRITEGVSSWLFVGQLSASTGFVIYSWLLGNWVFLFTNLALLATAITGQFIYRRNKRLGESGPASPRATPPGASHGQEAPRR